jgi:hypothetical protein
MNHVLSKSDQYLLDALSDLNRPLEASNVYGLTSRLHKGQIDVLKPLYMKSDTDTVFLQCGRKFGKTEVAVYALWRKALTTPRGACYYICPETEHGRKLVWDTQRLQRFIQNHSKYIKKINEREMKITFKNDAFIQVMGSENWHVANGLTPAIAVYDEFKVFHRKWHTEFNPNRIAKKAPLVIIGTPPKAGDRNMEEYFRIAEECRFDKRSFWFQRSSYENPVIDKNAIDREIEKLRLRGEEDVIQREYFGRIVVGGSMAIFPMLSRDKHVKRHEDITRALEPDRNKLEWYCFADPGTSTCFGVLIAALNPYTRKLYILNEIYEKDQTQTTTRSIFPRMQYLMMTSYPNSNINDDWFKGYDEAAAWFANEVIHQYGVALLPSSKASNSKENGISLIKDMLLYDTIVISDSCKNLLWEMENYAKTDKGDLPRKNNHLIDCLRYILGASNYNMVEALEAKNSSFSESSKRRTFKDDFESDLKNSDWTYNIGGFDPNDY